MKPKKDERCWHGLTALMLGLSFVTACGTGTGGGMGPTQQPEDSGAAVGIRIVSNDSPLANMFFDDRALGPGDTIVLAADVYDSLGHLLPGHHVTWSTQTASLVTVDSLGRVVGRSAQGDAEVTASAGPNPLASESLLLYVRPHVAAIVPDSTHIDLAAAQVFVVSLTLRDSTGADLGYRNLAFATSDSTVATVTQGLFATQAQVTAVGPGTATISASREGHTGTFTVTVSP